jgi:hypothetical protein
MRTQRIDRPVSLHVVPHSDVPLASFDPPPMSEDESAEIDRVFFESATREGAKLVARMSREGLETTAAAPDYWASLDWLRELVTPILTAPSDAEMRLEQRERMADAVLARRATQ